MPSTDELDARLRLVEDRLNNAVLLPSMMKKYNDPDVQPGDAVFGGGDPNIFGGDNFIGTAVNAPVATSSDLTNEQRW